MGLISLISAAVYWFAGWFLFRGIKKLTAHPSRPRRFSLSVVIPARNEEESLPRLLESLRKQRHAPGEIIVVDDSSDDRTAAIARSFGCKVISLTGKPESWTGKSWACWNGANSATSEVLLFLDADVRCGKDAVELLTGTFEKHGGLVSVQPKHVTRKLYEQISAFFNIVSVAAAGRRGGFGPCMVCSRKDYFATGGHKAIGASVVDDFALAKLFLDNGLKVTSFLGGDQLTFRMYPEGLGELFEGWTKNMAVGFSLSNPISVLIIFIWFMGIINAVISVIQNFAGSQELLIAAAVTVFALYVAQVYMLLLRVGRFRFLTSLLFPVFFAFFLVLFTVSAVLTTVVGKVRWKGRVIPLR